MAQIAIDIPEDLLGQGESSEAFAQQIKLAAALYWYTKSQLSQGKAAQLAELNRKAFLEVLAREKIDVFQVDFADLSQALALG